MKIMKMHLPSIATVLAILAALLFAKPAAAQIAPIITTQPESVSTTNNAIVTFQVAISGSSNMVSDWFLSGKYVFGTTNKAVLAVTNSLVLPDISTTNAGSYLVVITNDWGSITSSVATLTVTNATVVTNTPPLGTNSAPVILLQPRSVSTTNGATATFKVVISGSPNMVSDWYFNGQYVSGTTNEGVLGATNSLVLPDISTTNAGSYLVVITNDWGSITSSVATLTVTNATVVTNTPPPGTNSAPVILLPPRNISTTNGATATFKVVISGSSNMVSDWYFNGQYVSGTTNQGALVATNSLVLPDISTTNAGSYLVVITNDWGSITSSVATLTVTNATVVTNTPPLGTNSAPVILLQPRSVSTTNGATATFKVVISGSPNMVSDWYFNGQYVSGITNEGVLGATNSLVLPDISTTNAGSYLVVITNDWGSITSSVATLTVTNLSGGGIPRISILSGTPRGVTLNLLTLSGTSSRLWVATNLYPPVIWTPVATNVSGTNGIWQFTDTNASQYPVRFYRTSTP